MDPWGRRSVGDIEILNRGITAVIRSAIEWLAEGSGFGDSQGHHEMRAPVHLGCRKLAYLLKGSANTTALNLRFHECPYWGSLAFLSVRKLERILRLLVSQDVLQWDKSPQLKLNVLNINKEWQNDTIPDISDAFASDSRLSLQEVDVNLLAAFKRLRLSLSSRPYGRKSRPYVICSDRVLIQMCIHRPSNILELRSHVAATENFIQHYAERFIRLIHKESD